MPEIVVAYKPAGRATLDAIADELVPLPIEPLPMERQSSSPEIIVHEGLTERGGFPAIVVESRGSSPELPAPASAPVPAVTAPIAPAEVPPSPIVSVGAGAAAPGVAQVPRPAAQALEIFEMVTYVVRGGDVARLASEAARRAFVEEHLLARLPVRSMNAVERVDVMPWTVQGTLVVRVWCRTSADAPAR
jgi:hypothetical protein